MLYAIRKAMSMNVGNWILSNIRHAVNNLTVGLPFLTLITELIATVRLCTSSQEVLQTKK